VATADQRPAFHAWVRRRFGPALVRTVLRVAASAGDSPLYDRYLERLHNSSGRPDEYDRFLTALVSFRSPDLVARTLDFALSPAVRSQDAPTLVAGLLSLPWGRDLAWTFLPDRWPDLTTKLGVFQGIPAVLGAVAGFCDPATADAIRAFFAKHPVPAAARVLEQAVERIRSCVALGRRQATPFATWLAATGE
jgi:puromycin-sensitive aminopeptidase